MSAGKVNDIHPARKGRFVCGVLLMKNPVLRQRKAAAASQMSQRREGDFYSCLKEER